MSEETDSSISGGRVVFVRLLGEGTTVYRPVDAVSVAPSLFRLESRADYDPEDEEWEYPPGSVVVCERRELQGAHVLVAVAAQPR